MAAVTRTVADRLPSHVDGGRRAPRDTEVPHLTEDKLRRLLRDGTPADVADVLISLPEADRRALAGAVRTAGAHAPATLAKRPEAALLLAGAACLPRADAIVSWLRSRRFRHVPSDTVLAELLRVLTAPGRPRLASVAAVLTDRLRPRPSWPGEWAVVAAILRATGSTPPPSDALLRAWVRAHAADPATLAEHLAADPWLDHLLPRVFDTAGVDRNWPPALTQLAATGRLDRGLLLRLALHRLRAGGTPAALRPAATTHALLNPAPEEVARHRKDYLALLDSPQAALAYQALHALDDPHDTGADQPGPPATTTGRARSKPSPTAAGTPQPPAATEEPAPGAGATHRTRKRPARPPAAPAPESVQPARPVVRPEGSPQVPAKARHTSRAAAAEVPPSPPSPKPAAAARQVTAAKAATPQPPTTTETATDRPPATSPATAPGEPPAASAESTVPPTGTQPRTTTNTPPTGPAEDAPPTGTQPLTATSATPSPTAPPQTATGAPPTGPAEDAPPSPATQPLTGTGAPPAASGEDGGGGPPPVLPAAAPHGLPGNGAVSPASPTAERLPGAGAAAGPRDGNLPEPVVPHFPPAPVAVPAEAMPPAFGTVRELVTELGALLERPLEPIGLERILAGVLALAHSEWDALVAAVTPLAGRVPPPLDVLLRALVRPGPVAERPAEAGPPPATIVPGRIRELAQQLATALPPALLATPATVDGLVSPVRVLFRLIAAERDGWQPGPYDLAQTLLRLPATVDPTVHRAADRLTSPAGLHFAAWLRSGGLPPVSVTVTGGPRRLATFAPPPAPALPQDTPPEPAPEGIPPLLHDPAPAVTVDSIVRDLLLPPAARRDGAAPPDIRCWPLVLPRDRELVAAHCLPYLAVTAGGEPTGDEAGAARAAAETVRALAGLDGRFGTAMALAVAHGLVAEDEWIRQTAVGTVLHLAARSGLDSGLLGRELRALLTPGSGTGTESGSGGTGSARIRRVAGCLGRIGEGRAWHIVWAIGYALVPALLRQRPVADGVPDLLAVAADAAAAIGARADLPEVVVAARESGRPELAAEAARLARTIR